MDKIKKNMSSRKVRVLVGIAVLGLLMVGGGFFVWKWKKTPTNFSESIFFQYCHMTGVENIPLVIGKTKPYKIVKLSDQITIQHYKT